MEQVQLVYAEVMNGITFSMLEDPQVVIISDNSVFIVTTKENSKNYDEVFYPVDEEGIEAYDLLIIFSRNKPR